MRKSSNQQIVRNDFKIGSAVTFAGKKCVVTGYQKMVTLDGESCLWTVLTRPSINDWVVIDPYEWDLT